MTKLIWIMTIGLFFSNCFGNEIKNEKLNVGVPEDWKVAYSKITDTKYIVELTHKSESVE